MNRLIIVGNGFDLAHGLPTSYGSFLDFIWQNLPEIKNNVLFKNLFNINFDHLRLESFDNYDVFCSKLKFYYRSNEYSFRDSFYGQSSFSLYYQHPIVDENPTIIFEFKNKLLELIIVRNAENWVDIENIYYQALLSIVKRDGSFPQLGNIDQLNEDFLQIKMLLDHYLNKCVENIFSFTNGIEESRSIVKLFDNKFKDLERNNDDEYFLEFPPDYRMKLIEWDNKFRRGKTSLANDETTENLFLDFNYTSNVANYVSVLNRQYIKTYGNYSQIQIHGRTNSKSNSINFGFGDEMDDHYKILESTGDNKFLENIKSFMYFNNSNYRKLLNWIETYDFQVFIMGHSCGLSDRTLLNTIFEHNNCKSIKIFYHKKEETDNFTELAQNISRHFNKKSMMRQKVVDKTHSIPLPQDVRYRELKSM